MKQIPWICILLFAHFIFKKFRHLQQMAPIRNEIFDRHLHQGSSVHNGWHPSGIQLSKNCPSLVVALKNAPYVVVLEIRAKKSSTDNDFV